MNMGILKKMFAKQKAKSKSGTEQMPTNDQRKADDDGVAMQQIPLGWKIVTYVVEQSWDDYGYENSGPSRSLVSAVPVSKSNITMDGDTICILYNDHLYPLVSNTLLERKNLEYNSLQYRSYSRDREVYLERK